MQYEYKDIDGVRFIEGVPEREFEAISGEFSMALDKSRTPADRIKAFFRGENQAGRIAGSVLDIGTIFLPFGRKVQTGREAAKVILNRKKEPKMDKAKRWIKQPSTKAGITVLVALLALIGIDLDPDLIEESAKQIVTGAALVVAGVVSLYEMVRDEDDKEDS